MGPSPCIDKWVVLDEMQMYRLCFNSGSQISHLFKTLDKIEENATHEYELTTIKTLKEKFYPDDFIIKDVDVTIDLEDPERSWDNVVENNWWKDADIKTMADIWGAMQDCLLANEEDRNFVADIWSLWRETYASHLPILETEIYYTDGINEDFPLKLNTPYFKFYPDGCYETVLTDEGKKFQSQLGEELPCHEWGSFG